MQPAHHIISANRMQKVVLGLLLISSLLVLYVFTYNLVVLSYYPIYPDEIAVRLWLSRAGYDFPWHTNIFPGGRDLLIPLSIFWYVPGWIEWFLHGFINSLFTLRQIGVASYLCMIFLLANGLIGGVKKGGINYSIMSVAFVTSLLAFGIQPVCLVINRPEQIILLGLLILLFMDRRLQQEIRKPSLLLLTLLYFLTISLMMYVHPKVFYFTPAFLLLAYRFFLKFPDKKFAALIFAFLFLLIVGNLQAWHNELQYPDNPSLQAAVDHFNINLADWVNDPPRFYQELKTSMTDEIALLTKIGFQIVTEVRFLPEPLHFPYLDLINDIIAINCLILLVVLSLTLAWGYYQDIRQKNYFSSRLFFWCILLAVVGGSILNLTKTWYDVGYFWAVVAILLIACFFGHFQRCTKNLFFASFVLYFMLSAVMSLLFFNFFYEAGILSGFRGVNTTLIDFSYQDYATKIEKMSKRCHIDPVSEQGLVLDDYTYLYFKQSKYPILITYINSRSDEENFLRLIKENKIKALITRCDTTGLFSKYIAADMIKEGELCCYPQDKIQALLGKKI